MARNFPAWAGVFPAITTQFDTDDTIDVGATQRVVERLLGDGVHGLVMLGTVGEGNALDRDEKGALLSAVAEVARGRAPVIAGVAHYTTAGAVALARAARDAGADGLMVLPPMVYLPTSCELEAHFRAVAQATDLPVMIYNNPASYHVTVPVDLFVRLLDQPNIIAVKESADDTRRFTDLINAVGSEYLLFAGLDDMAFEALALGAIGWVSGLTNAFPRESVALFERLQQGDLTGARAIYRWFMPLLHLDAQPDLVQSIKLAEELMERGSERVRLPRLPLAADARARVIELVKQAVKTRPDLAPQPNAVVPRAEAYQPEHAA